MTTPAAPDLFLYQTLKPSMGSALGRVHRLWRNAINQAVGDLGMTEARWAVMMHLDKVGEGCTQQALATELEEAHAERTELRATLARASEQLMRAVDGVQQERSAKG